MSETRHASFWRKGSAQIRPEQPVCRGEAEALLRYGAEQGLNAGLIKQLRENLDDGSNADGGERLGSETLSCYAELVTHTHPVNGRTLIETARSRTHLRKLSVITVVFLVFALGNDMLAIWLREQPAADEGLLLTLGHVRLAVVEPLAPFLWGAIGACVYLLKKLYDLAAKRQFDRERLHGWPIRVLLGAILAFAALSIFNPESLSSSDLGLQPTAVAFLVGLGVKVAYGGFERAVALLAEKMNLDALRGEPSAKGQPPRKESSV